LERLQGTGQERAYRYKVVGLARALDGNLLQHWHGGKLRVLGAFAQEKKKSVWHFILDRTDAAGFGAPLI